MKLQSKQLRDGESIELSFSLSPEYITEHLHTKREFEPDLLHQDTQVSLTAKKISLDLWIEGKIHATLDPHCCRCAEDMHIPLEQSFSFFVSPYPNKQYEDESYEDREGMYYFSDPIIDLAPLIREQLYIHLPMVFLCKEDCKGLCSTCGENLNLGTHHCKKQANPVKAVVL
ncbi:MAG: DUF177 domain-containing protein [Bdellovibrionales bacterium]|nr:DUF177 domain-containing protein [Bdellovibrionales bacterium]